MKPSESLATAAPISASYAIEVAAPARVNLLGEHTDYTGGFVLPMAIPFYTSVTLTSSPDGLFSFRSESFPGQRSVALSEVPARSTDWTDYPIGVLFQLEQMGIYPPPASFKVSGNVPIGAGLSSSASVEVAACLAMLQLAKTELSVPEIARACQRAENEFVGSPCGIMDQFVVTAAHAGHALMLSTRDLSFESIPMNTGGFADVCIVVFNSRVKHSVAAGEYGNRRREVEAGQAIMLGEMPFLGGLVDATLEQLEKCRLFMPPKSFKRCRHILSENQRVHAAKEALLSGDPGTLGKIMLAAHESQRDDFECSCEEIDFLVDAAMDLEGCFGARLTGGGFGGCTVNIVQRSAADLFCEALKQRYREQFGKDGDAYVCEAVDGAMAMQTRASGKAI
jgi:galactokinase